MEKVILELDILDQLRLMKAGNVTGKSTDELVVQAMEKFLSAEGSNNPDVRTSATAA